MSAVRSKLSSIRGVVMNLDGVRDECLDEQRMLKPSLPVDVSDVENRACASASDLIVATGTIELNRNWSFAKIRRHGVVCDC